MFHPLEKELPVTTLHLSEISTFKTPLPLGISTVLGGGGEGMDIFWNHTVEQKNINKQKKVASIFVLLAPIKFSFNLQYSVVEVRKIHAVLLENK